jgi:hypothetical protein
MASVGPTHPTGPALTPTQDRLLTDLIALGGPRPEFDRHLASRLRHELDVRTEAALDAVNSPGSPGGPAWRFGDDRPLIVLAKHALASIHACERRAVAEEGVPFEWSPATAQGAVAHKAVEFRIHGTGDFHPGDLVSMAIDRLIDDERGPAPWLRTATPAERAELVVGVVDAVTKFDDTFPPIPARWRPRVESRLRTSLAGGRIELVGRVDLALGRAEGTQARVLIVDLKTGHPSMVHPADLRFYALLETLRVGVPPFRLASFYLDSGEWRGEDVDEDLLWSTAYRVADGLDRLIALRLGGRPPTVSPGPGCRYCPARLECPAGQQWPGDVDGGDDTGDEAACEVGDAAVSDGLGRQPA